MSDKEIIEAIHANGLNDRVTGFSEKSQFVQLLTNFYASQGITFVD
jgi:hypothetical protein